MRRILLLLFALALVGAPSSPGSVLLPPSAVAQVVPTPESHFGFALGSDRKLADWHELTAYYERLARSSPRVVVDTLGETTRGLPFVMLTVTSAANQARLDELHEVQMKLADPRRISGAAELARLLEVGRTVVLITHAIHSTEVGGAQMAARLLWRLASSDDPGIREILDNVILLDIPSLNPDGTQWVVEWYREHVGTEYEGAPLPWLYHFYVGHDNNRDWYAFTQKETQLAILGAHNRWHPQIVHDIHQMGGSGARIFFPPYVEPWEPNIDPALTSAVSQLGTWMAAELLAEGKKGVVVNAIYDAYTPARAYQHYHAGARILSETASARLATPVEVDPADLEGRRGYEATERSWNFPSPWPGGEWGLPDIVDYMESGALALLSNAARNRRYWLESFHGIGQRAVAGWDRWPAAWILPATAENLANRAGLEYVLRILAMGDVEVHRAESDFAVGGERFPSGSWIVPMGQPYAAFAQTLLERQEYPDLREYPGGPPQRPYDVTAHTLPLLVGIEAVPVEESPRVAMSGPVAAPEFRFELPASLSGEDAPRVGMYKSWREPMEAGWTRWMFDQHGLAYDTLHDADIRGVDLARAYDVILLQAQDPGSILDGFDDETVPGPYAGGLGEAGARALRDFVRGGGRIVAVEEATELVIDLFELGVGNAVERLPSDEFYVPGSIVAIDRVRPDGDVVPGAEVHGWFWRSSRAFEVRDPTVRTLARYGECNPVRSGWILGPDHLAGKPALLSAAVGRGSVVLFGFQPNYRGQTMATWPLLFDALSVPRRGR
jgi:hypothetical protein